MLSYPGLVAQQLGSAGALTMQLALLVNCGGMLVAYLVVMRDLVHGALHQFRVVVMSTVTTHASQPTWLSIENVVLAALVLCVLGPLVSFRYVTQYTMLTVLLGVDFVTHTLVQMH